MHVKNIFLMYGSLLIEMEGIQKRFFALYGQLTVVILISVAALLYMHSPPSDQPLGRMLDSINLAPEQPRLGSIQLGMLGQSQAFSHQGKQIKKGGNDDDTIRRAELLVRLFRSKMDRIQTGKNQGAALSEAYSASQWKEILKHLGDQRRGLKDVKSLSKEQLILVFISKQQFVNEVIKQIQSWKQEITKPNASKLLAALRNLLSDLRSTIAKLRFEKQSQMDTILHKYLTAMLNLVVTKSKNLEDIMSMRLCKNIELKNSIPDKDDMSTQSLKREWVMMESTEAAAHQIFAEHRKKLRQHLMSLEQMQERSGQIDWLKDQIAALNRKVNGLRPILVSMMRNVKQYQERKGGFDQIFEHISQEMQRFQVVQSMLKSFTAKQEQEGEEQYEKARKKINMKSPANKKTVKAIRARSFMQKVIVAFENSFLLTVKSNQAYAKVQRDGWKAGDDKMLQTLRVQSNAIAQLWINRKIVPTSQSQRMEAQEKLGLCREMLAEEKLLWLALKQKMRQKVK